MNLSRRHFLEGAGLAGLAAIAPDFAKAGPMPDTPADIAPDIHAKDSAYWEKIASQYHVTERITNLENGFWGIMANPVLADYQRQIERVNAENSMFARGGYNEEEDAVRARVAKSLGVSTDEIALTRGATEALQNLITGYNRLRPGDTVMYADLDYHSMQYCMNWLTERRGVKVVRFAIPEPATREAVITAYREAFAQNPGVRLLLLTHLSNRTGLVMPVSEIAAVARENGADVILDAAHSWGQFEFKTKELGVDFTGFNLHKWIGAPLGVGAMYIRRDRLSDIDLCMADENNPADDIRSRVHSGTANFAAYLTVPSALDFHERIGPAYKEARLRYLRNRWVHALRGHPGLDILTPDDPAMHAAITSFRLKGKTAKEDNQAIVRALAEEHNIFTVWRTGIAAGDCVRVTPALYNSEADIDRLVAALRTF